MELGALREMAGVGVVAASGDGPREVEARRGAGGHALEATARDGRTAPTPGSPVRGVTVPGAGRAGTQELERARADGDHAQVSLELASGQRTTGVSAL
ncbi:MAG TPA: hypothetical protein VKY90_11610 [Candidatus Dormibacteraeota bacterium]|nr:hypothetical protein [Candidatus Dormibacteraeota bacterium]